MGVVQRFYEEQIAGMRVGYEEQLKQEKGRLDEQRMETFEMIKREKNIQKEAFEAEKR